MPSLRHVVQRHVRSRAQSRRHREAFLASVEPAAEAELFARLARESLEEQAQIERADTLSFEDYVANYFRQ